MFFAMNRFRINPAFEKDFVAHWKNRQSSLESMPGFVRFDLLQAKLPVRNSDAIEAAEIVSFSQWIDQAAFENWMQSQAMQKSHERAAQLPRETFMGPPEFRGYVSVMTQGHAHRTDFRSSHMDHVIEATFAGETDEQRQIVAKSREAGFPPIHVGALEGRILEILLRAINARKGIEIGTLGAYSTSWLARGLANDGKMVSIERDAIRADLARKNLDKLGLGDRVEVRCGQASDVLKNLETHPDFARDLDFVFIDADKQNYGKYVAWALPRLRKGGLLLADNALLWGGMNYYGRPAKEVAYPPQGQLHSFDEPEFLGMSECWTLLRSHPEFASVILPTGEGLGIAIKL